MRKEHKKIIKLLVILILISAVPCMLLNYIVDPLQFYRKSYYFNNVLYKYQRFQNPGLAKNYDYDTVIIGTSMTENFMPSDIKDILGMDTLKLSISAASAYEQRKILQIAIRTGKVKNVIWGLDFSSFRGGADRKGVDDTEFPDYMYDLNPFNDFKYLLNDKTTELSIMAMIRLIRYGPANKYLDVSRYSVWYPSAVFGEAAMREEGRIFEQTNKGAAVVYTEAEKLEIMESVKQNLIDVTAAYPDITFYVFYTPASVLRELYFISKNMYDMEIDFKRYVDEELIGSRNVKLFDFQAAAEIILNFNRYSDYSHYDPDTLLYILECMKEDRYLVTAQNDHLDEFMAIVSGYAGDKE
jgi:hypothetical protein